MSVEIPSTSVVRGMRRPTGLAPFLVAIVLTVVAFLWLDYVNPPFAITEDGVRDQLAARDCADLGQCHLIGTRSSLAELHHGAVWLDVLIAVRLLGGDTSTARALVLALLALGAGTFCVVMWRWVRPSIAVPASILLIGWLSVSRDPPQLVNGSVSGFPDILTAVGLLCYGLSGRLRFLVFTAVALGVAIDVHVGSLSLVPALVAIAALAGRRPWRNVLVAAATVFATSFITSRAALLANAIGLARSGYLPALVLAAAVLVFASARLSSRFNRLSRETRAWIIGLIVILPFAVATAWLVLWRQHHFDVRYLHPIVAPGAAVAAALLCVPFEIASRRCAATRWLPTVAAVVVAGVVALRVDHVRPAHGPLEHWTIADAVAVAEQVTSLGWSYEDLAVRLQAVACEQLLAGISVSAPRPNPVARTEPIQVQVFKARVAAMAALAPDDHVIPLEGGVVAVVRQIDSWLRPQGLRACRRPTETNREAFCVDAALPSSARRIPDQFLFVTRAYPGVHGLDVAAPYVAAYEIPIVAAAGETRDFTVVGETVPGCAWQIMRVEGAAVEGSLPSRRARVYSSDGSPGLMIVEKAFGTTACPGYDVDIRYPPCLFETTPNDPLAALLEVR